MDNETREKLITIYMQISLKERWLMVMDIQYLVPKIEESGMKATFHKEFSEILSESIMRSHYNG